ncbi:hypothetical protein ATO11_08820 [Pseudaestuariivita atlantica]|uniref:Uncharacterized protein n=1 Tax=Pseudaestuariivita atlantica TaxID=1317121 RepID=A0A0L1JRF2_9RHOB|nr:hypothetical protein ATO11_08820 [Pseudaestuariivita atlantica]
MTGVALADEVWTSNQGDIVYVGDNNNDAIFAFTYYNGQDAAIILPGFTRQWDYRHTNLGVWISQVGNACDSEMVHASGVRGTSWGKVKIEWAKTTGPSDFVLTTGDCEAEPTVKLWAKAK